MTQSAEPRGEHRSEALHREVGGYRLVQELGSGGMGVVYLALNDHGRAVALKLLRPDRVGDPEARLRLAREVATARRVRHPRVAAVLDADIEGPEPFIVTEYVPGIPLDEVVEEEGGLSRAELVQLARGLAEALTAIHRAGVVHRDLKPSNVMLVDSGPVIIDFGIATGGGDSRLTSTGLVMGTPGYVTPEVLEGGDISPATDWWGWAVTLAYAASGEPPFGEGSMQQVMTRVVSGRADLSGVDPLLAPLLAAALATDPRARLSAPEVMAGLERYAHGETALDTPVAPMSVLLPTADDVAAYEPRLDHAPAPRSLAPAPGMLAVPGTASLGDPIAPWVWHGDPRVGLPMRSLEITALLLLITAFGAVAPAFALTALVLWAWVARTVDRSMTFIVLRRHQVGPRRGDKPLAWLLSPWHVVSEAVLTPLSLVLPAFLGLIASGAVLLGIAATGPVSTGELWGLASAAGIGVTVWALWWGLGGASLRRGTRSIVRQATWTGIGRVVLLVVVALTVVVLVGAAYSAHGRVLSWWPADPAWIERMKNRLL